MKTVDFIREQKQRIDAGDTLARGEKSCASVFATNDRIYSYGYHYPLLFQVDTPSNGTVWVCNNGGYSNTTAKHISYSAPLADVFAPIGGTHGQTVTIETVIRAITSKLDSVIATMKAKKRHDTAVYRDLQRQYERLNSDLELLSL